MANEIPVQSVGHAPAEIADPSKQFINQAIRGAGNFIADAIQGYKQGKVQGEGNAVLDMYENANLDLSTADETTAADIAEGVDEVDQPELTETEIKGLTQAEKAARKLSLLEAQAGASNRIDQKRVALYRKYKEQFPQHTDRLRKFFDQQYGKTPLEMQRELAEEEATSAQQEFDAQIKIATDVLTEMHQFEPGMTNAEIMERFQVIQGSLARYEQSKLTLEQAKTDQSIDNVRAQRIQQRAWDGGIDGLMQREIMEMQSRVSRMNLDDADTTLRLKQEIDQRLTAVKAIMLQDYNRIDQGRVNALVEVLADVANQAKATIDGTEKVGAWNSQVEYLTTQANNQIMRTPGFPEAHARVKILGDLNIPDFEFSAAVNEWKFVDMLTQTSTGTQSQRNAYKDLIDKHGVDFSDNAMLANAHYLTHALNQTKDKPQALEVVANSLMSWSSNWKDPNEKVPAKIGDAWINMVGDPASMKALDFQPLLVPALNNMFRQHEQGVRSSMLNMLSKPLTADVPDIEVQDPTEGQPDLLGSLMQAVGFDVPGGQRQARLVDLVKLNVNDDGVATFTLLPEARRQGVNLDNDLRVLNEKFAPRLTTLGRGYAHVQFKKDTPAAYKQAMDEILTIGGFSKVTQVRPTAVFSEQPQRVRVERGEDGRLRRVQ